MFSNVKEKRQRAIQRKLMIKTIGAGHEVAGGDGFQR
jgi:hypothetical protein